MLDFATQVAGGTVFSKIDLQKGYQQIPVNQEDVQKTGITTPFGLFEYKRMPFDLRNSGPSFQHLVDRAIRDCHSALAWFDNVTICNRNHKEHVVHVRQILQALQYSSLVITLSGYWPWRLLLHVGKCLQQQVPGKKDWQPRRFSSKKLETGAAQQKYFVFDRELFACSS